MPYMEGPRKARMWEKDNYKQGRSGGKSPIMPGPNRSFKHNPQASGGINRATKGTGAGKRG